MSRFLNRLIDVNLTGFALGALATAYAIWLDPYGLGQALQTLSIGPVGTLLLWAGFGSAFAAGQLMKDMFQAIDSVG